MNYEHNFNSNNSIELTCNLIWYRSTDNYSSSNNEKYIFFIPAWRHYLLNKNNDRNITWLSAYSQILYYKYDNNEYNHFFAHHDNSEHTALGLGVAIGKRLEYGKRRMTFIDIGIGGSYNVARATKPILLPRIIFLIGRKI